MSAVDHFGRRDLSKVRHGLAIVSVLSLAAVALLLPSLAFGANDRLACQFTSLDVLRQTFSYPVTRVRREFYAYSHSAPWPRNVPIAGADISSCWAEVWEGGPYPKAELESISAYQRVPSGVGELIVTTHVRDAGPAGNDFDAGKFFRQAAAQGRHPGISVPAFGLKRAYGSWYAKKNQFAYGVWQHGQDGTIEVLVAAHRDAIPSLRTAAELIVPNFSP